MAISYSAIYKAHTYQDETKSLINETKTALHAHLETKGSPILQVQYFQRALPAEGAWEEGGTGFLSGSQMCGSGCVGEKCAGVRILNYEYFIPIIR